MAAHIEIKNTQLQRKRIWEYDFFPIRYDVAPINIHKINCIININKYKKSIKS